MSQATAVPGGTAPLAKAEARRVLATWLNEYPGALVGALGGNGIPAPIPAGLDLPGFEREERSVLDLVIPDDSRAVTDGFMAGLARGVSVTRVHLASDPDQVVLLHYLDLREEFGVLLRMLVSGANDTQDSSGPLSSGHIFASGPRLGFMTKDELAHIVSVDEAATLMLGWTAADMVGRRSLEFIHPDDHTRAIDNWMARRTNPSGVARTVRLRHLRPDGSWLWVEISNEFVEQDGSIAVHTQIIDISSEMAASEALRRSESLLRLVTDTVPVGLFHISCEGEVVFVNPVAQRLLGVTIPATRGELCKILAPGREDDLEEAITRVLDEGGEAHLDLEFSSPGNGRSSCQVSLRTVLDQERTAGVLGCIVDVTKLKQIADTDALTGLENRRSIMHTLAHDLKAHHGRVAAIFVDLDHFKPVNDRFGHSFGDHTLTAVAERLRGALRPQDRIGRLGGDEFLVICPGVRVEQDALDIARRIRSELDGPLALEGRALTVTASVGVSLGSRSVSADELVAIADAAMYQAKQDRGGPPVFLSARPAATAATAATGATAAAS